MKSRLELVLNKSELKINIPFLNFLLVYLSLLSIFLKSATFPNYLFHKTFFSKPFKSFPGTDFHQNPIFTEKDEFLEV